MRFFVCLLGIVFSLTLSTSFAWSSEDSIAIIVNPSVNVKLVKKEEIALIFRRKKLFWSEGSKVNPVNLAATNNYRRLFSSTILLSSPEEMQDYWNNMYFHGISPPYIVSSEAAALKFVEETAGAIGYVPICSVSSKVLVLMTVSPLGKVNEDTSNHSCNK